MATRWIGVAMIAGLAASAWAQAPAGPRRVLLDGKLEPREVTLRAIDADAVTFADARGGVRREPLSGLVAVLAPAAPDGALAGGVAPPPPATPQGEEPPEGEPAEAPAAADAPTRAVIELTDGQRLVGALRLPAGQDGAAHETVRLVHATLGELVAPLDRVRRITLERAGARPARRGTPDASADAVVLASGDRLSGFVELLPGEAGPLVRVSDPAGRAAPREVPLERVVEIALAAPEQPAGGVTLWLDDGSVVRAASLSTGSGFGGEVAFTPELSAAGGVSVVAASSVTALATDAARLRPLAAASITVKPGREGAWAEPPRLSDPRTAPMGLTDVELVGDVEATLPLPEGARWASMDLVLPRSAWVWGEAGVTISAQGRTLWNGRLTGADPVRGVRAEVPAGARSLTVRLTPGEGGPAQTRVVLARGVALVGK